MAARVPTREEAGLPAEGFVFCCFNNNWKITRQVFDLWMRLLSNVDGSVLWLFRDNDCAERNLRGEAAVRGIDPARLVFAGRLPVEEHLARHRLADHRFCRHMEAAFKTMWDLWQHADPPAKLR